ASCLLLRCAVISLLCFFSPLRPPPRSPLFPYTTLFRSPDAGRAGHHHPAARDRLRGRLRAPADPPRVVRAAARRRMDRALSSSRSEEHTSELQSRFDLVCRLLLEKKNTISGMHQETLAS